MEDSSYANAKDVINVSSSLAQHYGERAHKFAANGHEAAGEEAAAAAAPPDPGDPFRKRINPLKIHLGKRPYVDNNVQQHFSSKKLSQARRPSEPPVPTPLRVPKLIPKRKIDRQYFHNIAPHALSIVPENEDDKPVPRLVPKSQLHQFRKGIAQKGAFKDYPQNMGQQQPTVKFKCRKCCSMSFKTLAMLKEHQRVCRAQAKEPVLSPEGAPPADTSAGGPSRVTRKVYLCSACGTYYENWNLFLHMREVHNRHICLFCLGMFSKAEKLSAHLMNKHNVQEHSYESKEDFCSVYNGTLFLMCCDCDAICSEQDDFFNHDCNKVIPRPVPVLVSKSAAKMNNMKQTQHADTPSNGPSSLKEKGTCDITKPDNKDINEFRQERISHKSEPPSTLDMRRTSHNSADYNDRRNSLENTDTKKGLSTVDYKTMPSFNAPTSHPPSSEQMPNGDESIDYRENNASPVPMDVDPPAERAPLLWERPPAPAAPEKEGGIKLKLSLNNAKSPVIINSTVDPTVGQKVSKPPSRARRPPKRYEKDSKSNSEPTTPRTPSIKMTICDKADSPFVKTTIYENNQETTLKKLLNNNLESPKSHFRTESTIMSTIYDNKLEDLNTMNRVPKLTVRVPKELLDKDSSSDYSSDSEQSDKLTVDENTNLVESSEPAPTAEDIPLEPDTPADDQPAPEQASQELEPTITEPTTTPPQSNEMDVTVNTEEAKTDNQESENVDIEKISDEPPPDEIPVIELNFDRPLDRYPIKELLKIFLTTTVFNCIYCNHVRKIAVNCEQLSLHMAAEHRFSATVDSITAEELLPETITAKVRSDAETVTSVFINQDTYDSEEKSDNVQYDHLFECFQCYFKTPIHKDLYLHNRKMHQKTILLCVMCKSNFYSYSELLCHLCPGTYDSEYEMKFRCHLCNVDTIPSSFRLMVHLRKSHNACDVCLEFCQNQSRLSNHVWKHKLHHLCYRCGIAYRNKLDITNHLFWKHGTESVLCKRCMQKKWPHVYHFCSPPAVFVCDECNLQFSKAVYLKVHKRFHTNEFPHPCIEEGCTEKFVSKKLLMKHLEEHQRKLASEDLDAKPEKTALAEKSEDASKDPIPVIDLVNDDKPGDVKPDVGEKKVEEAEPKKLKKKKQKEKDALLLAVNLPELNLSESDSSDESDSGAAPPAKPEPPEEKPEPDVAPPEPPAPSPVDPPAPDVDMPLVKEDIEAEEKKPDITDDVKPGIPEDEKPDEKQVLEIWDNFKKFQAKTEKQREKTPPLVPIRKHVCESDHDYCLVPSDLNGDDQFGSEKKKKKRDRLGFSSSSSSSSDSDSSCSCGSNCSCSSSSGSSSSSSSDSDSSDEPRSKARADAKPKKIKKHGKALTNRRLSNGSNVDVMGMSETPILVPEKTEPLIPETDLDTNESDTDEEFYDEHPQKLANKMYAEKRNQLMLLASVAPSDGGAGSAEPSRPVTPLDQRVPPEKKEKTPGSKKKSKKKKRSKSSRKHGPIKLNIPKDIITSPVFAPVPAPLAPNKITISLQNNTVQIPEAPLPVYPNTSGTPVLSGDRKRASKRRRVPNKFYGYSSDEEGQQQQQAPVALKPHLPPKLEWRKEDLPSPVTHKAKKEVPSSTIPQKIFSYSETHRLSAPAPGPEPPRALMNSESMSSDSDSSDSGSRLEIYQGTPRRSAAPPPPTYLNSGTSSLPYAFQPRPAARPAREGESVYCYCRCPYDEVSEMIACDADGCSIEWFHFECVGIMVPPKGKWYCPECRKKQTYSHFR